MPSGRSACWALVGTWVSHQAALFRFFGFAPRPLQSIVDRLVDDLDGPALVIVEAPMGVGKTEAALYLAERLATKHHTEGMFIGLPTQATANQMLNRVRRFLESAYPERPSNLQLVHGDAILSTEFRDLRLSNVYDRDGAPSPVSAEAWFTQKKRALLAAFAVGTVDQALLSVLRVKHGFVRLFGLGGKIVVLDEVHAYDTYTSTLIDRLVEWLGACGVTVVLLSATLPSARRRALLCAYRDQDADMQVARYPRVSWTTRMCSGGVSVGGASRDFTLLVSPSEGDLEGTIAGLLAAIETGGCAALIANTVARAQRAFQLARKQVSAGGIALHLLHARFPYEDRERLETQIRDLYDREASVLPGLLIGTQVLEQSLGSRLRRHGVGHCTHRSLASALWPHPSS
jgi:CRISPR-associated endonuclease/helicase Cas3